MSPQRLAEEFGPFTALVLNMQFEPWWSEAKFAAQASWRGFVVGSGRLLRTSYEADQASGEIDGK